MILADRCVPRVETCPRAATRWRSAGVVGKRRGSGGGTGRDHGPGRAGRDSDGPPRKYAHSCRTGRLPGRPYRSGRRCHEAAVREAHEELLLAPAAVELVGKIEPYRTVTGYIVTPVLGVVPPDLQLTPHEHEVADWFEAPLAFLLDPANQHCRSALFQGADPPLLRNPVERTQDLGGDSGDDRQSVAPAAMELKLDAENWRKRRGMARLLSALGAEEGLTRYVGGAVRDELLGLPVNDMDLATRLSPDEVVRRLETAKIKAVPTGIEHGTITAVSDGQPVEVTTLRRDVSTDGRRATVAFTDDWQGDAARRDFTINALSADPVSGEIFDYFGGLGDLEHRHIRFIGDPLQRIAEDHLRILRFFRFHARFGSGKLDQAALDACAARANDLMALSRERIADELLKLLAVEDPSATIGIMLQRGILKPVLPEIERARLCDLESLG